MAVVAMHPGHIDFSYKALGRSRLSDKGDRLVSARSPASRHGHLEHSQVHAELAAVLVPVAKHHVAEKLRARFGENVLSAGNHTPGFLHCRVIEAWQQAPHCGNTVLKGLEDLLAARWLWK